MAFSRIPNRWLGIGETLQHAPQACQHSVWQPLGRPECAGSKYYTDDELRTTDEAGRRLFLSTEFNPTSGRSYANPSLSIGNKNRIPPSTNTPKRIIDCEVYDDTSKHVALSKAEFARNVNEQRGA